MIDGPFIQCILDNVHFRKRLQGLGLGQLHPENAGPGNGKNNPLDIATFKEITLLKNFCSLQVISTMDGVWTGYWAR